MSHPLPNMLESTLQKVREMINVDSVVGTPITTPEGITIIPVCKVSYGVGGGGSDFPSKNTARPEYPFGGGTGAGVTIQPMGFLVTNENSVRLLPAQAYAPADRIIELAPQLMCELRSFLKNKNEKNARQGEN